MKYKLGIIGYPLGHSISAVIQKAGFESIGIEVIFSGQSGLHHYRWRGRYRRYPEYGRPWYRETHYGDSGNRRAGACRRDQKEDVRIRRYPAA